MPEKEGQSLPELVVKEAVGAGMESPLRDTIVEAVEEAEGPRRRWTRLPLIGIAMGVGAGVGYLLGAQREEAPALDAESMPIEGAGELVGTAEEETGVETPSADEGGGSRLPKLALALLIGGAIALARRRLRSEEEGWEPIEEVETPVGEEGAETDVEGEATGEGGAEPSDEEPEAGAAGDAGEEEEEAEGTTDAES